jgi:hypothetical protein
VPIATEIIMSDMARFWFTKDCFRSVRSIKNDTTRKFTRAMKMLYHKRS